MNLHHTYGDSNTFFTIEYTYKAEVLDVECEVLFIKWTTILWPLLIRK